MDQTWAIHIPLWVVLCFVPIILVFFWSTKYSDVMGIGGSNRFERGTAALVAAHAEKEKTKVGILRAGNTGILLADGRVVGKCARLTYLRYKGITVEEPDHSRELMFAAGRTNEDSWMEVLRAADPTLVIKREEEIPIKWETGAGVPVTGRPDIVIGHDKDGVFVPEIGIELKQASSLWTVRDVGILLKPKMLHLMQGAHYSWQVGVPFELWYTSRTDFAVMGWAQRNFPRPGEPGSERCEYNEKGEIKKVLPFVQGYEMDWTPKDQLRYRPVGGTAPWTYTVITKDSIRAYFEFIPLMDSIGVLPPAPTNMEADGQKGNYSICDYCPLQATCESYKGKQVGEWVAKVLPQVSGKTK
jgi:hypothetical protein